MKSMKLFKLLLFLFFTSQYGCNINRDGEITIKVPEKGENSYVCYINGGKFVPSSTNSLFGKTSIFYPLLVYFSNRDNSLTIQAFNDANNISLHLINIDQIGTYYLNLRKLDTYGVDTTQNYCEYYSNSMHYFSNGPISSGKVNITELSDDKMIIKGNFEVIVYKIDNLTNEINLSDSIVISKGKFDINRKTLR
jgi:hypothetical protein